MGYLGLILTPEAYIQIPNAVEFVCPIHPGPFRLIIDSTHPAAKRTRAQTAATQNETDDSNIVYTHADIAQQKA